MCSLWQQIYLAELPGCLLLSYPIIMFLISRRRDTIGAYMSVDTSAIVMIIFSLCSFGVAFYYLFAKNNVYIGKKLLFSSPIIFFMLYHLWCGCTGIWSVDFQLTIFRAFECLSFMLLIIAVFQEIKKSTYMQIMEWSMLFITICLVMGILRGLRMGAGLAWYVVQFESTSFFFLALLFARRRVQKYLTVALACLSMSTAGYIGMATGSLLVLRSQRKKLGLYIIGFIFVGISLLFIDYKDVLRVTIFRNHPEIVENWDFTSHSSGRNTIHEIAIKAFGEHPIGGWGFVACEPYISHKISWGAGLISFHSGYLSALVGTGIVGFILFALFLSMLSIKAFSLRIPVKYRAFCQATLMVILAHTLTNPGMGTRVAGSWIPCFYLSALICLMCMFPKENKISA